MPISPASEQIHHGTLPRGTEHAPDFCGTGAAASAPGWSQFGILFISLLFGCLLPCAYYVCRSNRLIPGQWLWMADHNNNVKVIAGVALVALLAFIAWCAAQPKLLRRGASNVTRSAPLSLLVYALAFPALALLFFTWRQRLDFGDATWLKYADDPFIFSSSPLGHWIHWFFYKFARLTGLDAFLLKLDPYYTPNRVAVSVSSVAAGLAWFAGLVLLVPGIVNRNAASGALILFLTFAPTSLFYFSYPEVTPWAYTLLGLHFLAGIRYLRLNLARPPVYETIPLMLAIWDHGAVNFAAAAQALLLIHWFFKLGRPDHSGIFRPGRVLAGALLSIAPFFPLAATLLLARLRPDFCIARDGIDFQWYGDALGGGNLKMFLRAYDENLLATHVTFFGSRYVSAMLNIAISFFPLLPALPFAVRMMPRSRRPEVFFLVYGILGLLPYTLFWEADFGYIQDRDLYGFIGLPVYLLVALWWSERLTPRQQQAICIAVAAATFIFLLSPG